MKRLFRILVRAFIGLALVVGAALFALLLLDATGVLRERLESELASLVEDEPELSISLRALQIDWFAPSITLRGLHIRGANGEAHVEQLDCHFDLSKGGLSPLSAVHIESGRLLLERDFIEACTRSVVRVEEMLRERFGTTTEDPESAQDGALGMPTFTLHDFEIALRLVEGPLVELGKGQARLELNADENLSLVGNIDLPQEGGSPLPLFARATLTKEDRLEVEAAARNLRVSGRTSHLRALFPPALQNLDVTMKLSTDFRMTLSPTASTPPRANAHVRIEDGFMRPSLNLPPLEKVNIEGDFSWTPREALSKDSDLTALWQTLAVRAEVSAYILGEAMVGAAKLTRAGELEAELSAKGVAIDERLLVEAGLPESGALRQMWGALGLGGSADVNLGLRMPLTKDFNPARDLDVALHVRSAGQAKFCYFGWDFDGDGPMERQGVPLAYDQVSGNVVFGHRGSNARRELVGISKAEAYHGTGWARAEGMISSTLEERSGPDLDLILEVDDRTLNPELAVALNGSESTRDLFETYGIGGGTASARFHLRDRVELGGLSAYGTIHIDDAPMSWVGLPVDAMIDDFDLELRWADYPRKRSEGWEQRDLGAHFVARGSTKSVADLVLEGTFRDVDLGVADGARPMAARLWQGLPIPGSELPISGTGGVHSMKITGSGLPILGGEGSDWDALVKTIPELGEQANELGAKGRVDFRWTQSERVHDRASEVALEITPLEVQLLPKAFQMVTRNLAGRGGYSSLVHPDGAKTGTVDAIFAGDWVSDMRVAAAIKADISEGGIARLDVVGGGINPSNEALIGALDGMQGSSGGGFLSSASTSESSEDWGRASLTGRVDLAGQVVFKDELEPVLDLQLQLRENSLRTGPLALDQLRGQLRLTGGALEGPNVSGVLGATPIELTDFHVTLAEGARVNEVVLSATLSAEGLPLDHEHMGSFLDPESLKVLIDDFDLEGQIDLDDFKLSLAQSTDGRYRLVLSGHVIPIGMRAVAGTSLEIGSASVNVEELVLEGGRARAWGRMTDIAGDVGGRSVDGGTLLFSYADQRLNIEDLALNFAGGTMTSLGGDEGHGGAALALDLSERHHFAVAIELRDVEAKQLLAGAFGGSDDNSGTIDASIRLEAAPDNLLDAQGGGFLRLTDARLWSIPVFRALFTRLGFDATAVFDSMSSGFTISDGRISFNKMRAHSPLLKLVGDGFLDLDSNLGAQFEVRYSLIDKLGPFRELVYWFQNSLLTVEVKGDLYQPVVFLRTSLLDLFTSDPKITPTLPLPNRSGIPARF